MLLLQSLIAFVQQKLDYTIFESCSYWTGSGNEVICYGVCIRTLETFQPHLVHSFTLF